MTAIAGLAQGGRVWLGGDSAGVDGWQLACRRTPKVFRNGPYLVGYTTSFRMGQVLEHSFRPPAPPRRPGHLQRFLVVEWVDTLRSALKAAGWATAKDGQENGGVFLVGVRGRLFYIASDFAVLEPTDGYDAVGIGDQLARGALYATRGQRPDRRIRLALLAAQRHSGGVRGPFTILSTGA